MKEKPKPEEEDDDGIHEEAAERLKKFNEKYDKEIKKFGLFSRPLDSKNYLEEHPFLVCDETANHLVLWCLDLAMEEVRLIQFILLIFVLRVYIRLAPRCDTFTVLSLNVSLATLFLETVLGVINC